MAFYDRIRISFNQNNQYIIEIDEAVKQYKERKMEETNTKLENYSATVNTTVWRQIYEALKNIAIVAH